MISYYYSNKFKMKMVSLFILTLLTSCSQKEDNLLARLSRKLVSIELVQQNNDTQAAKIIRNNQFAKDIPALPKSFTLLNWNIYKGNKLSVPKLPFSSSGYDFVLLQEDTSKTSAKYFNKALGHYFLPTFKKDGDLTGTSIYSKYPAHKSQGFYSTYKEPFILTPKSFIVADFNYLRVINVHLLNFVSNSAWLSQTKKAFEQTHDSQHVIIAGDFNTWNDFRIHKMKELAKAYKLKEVLFKKDWRTKHLGLVIDYIFAKNLNLRSANIIPYTKYSDHAALEVTFERDAN